MVISNPLNDKKFKSDEAFQKISRQLVKMNRALIKENNIILRAIILNKLVKHMQATDVHFNELFEDVMYGGSFYKNLKVSKPDEYDLNLVVKLPIDYDRLQIEPDRTTPGYVKIRVLDREFEGYGNFWQNMTNEAYLDQEKFRSWIQSVLDRTLDYFPHNEDGYVLKCRKGRSIYKVKYRQSGPAFNIKVTRLSDYREINFDLVPCLLFRDCRRLPGFRPHEEEKWIAIAKPLRQEAGTNVRLLWRTGFYDDEKKLLAGHNKPVIRIIKKLRDINEWHQLKSYFIETLFLRELDEDQNFADNCESVSRTNVLMHMLRVLQRKLATEELFNYWHEELNMLADVPRLRAIASELQTIINRIDNNINKNKDILLTIFDISN